MAVLPAARKKSDEWRFPTKSSDQDWFAECARNQRSYGKLCRGCEGATATAKLNGAVAAATEKQSREKNGERRRHQGFKGDEETRRSHAAAFSMPAQSRRGPRARLEARRRSSAVRWLLRSLFTEITKLPLDLNPKILPNLCGNSKISKNKSCSKFKVLQLYFYNHTQIRSIF